MMSRRDGGYYVCHAALLLATLSAAGCEREPAPREVQVVTVPVPPVPASSATPTPSAAAPAVPAASATPAAAPVEAAATKTSSELGFYSRAGVRPIDDTCQRATAILHVIPKAVHDKPGFRWRFAEQVMLANQQLHVRQRAVSTDGKPVVAFVEAHHQPTGGVALIASCSNGAACNELAAAYEITVPTSQPELVCGSDPATLQRLGEVEVVPWDRAKIWAALPGKQDVIAQCVRLAACEAQKTGKLEGDPAIECQRRPSSFRIACATERFCDDVLACAAE